MDIIRSREVLATHSLTGKVSNAHKDKDPKPSLDVAKVSALCGKYLCNKPCKVVCVAFQRHSTMSFRNFSK